MIAGLRDMNGDDWSRARALMAALALAGVFLVVTWRATIVALGGGPERARPASVAAQAVKRADIIDRNGDLLAASLAFDSLAANPQSVWDPRDVAQGLASVLDDLDAARVEALLSEKGRKFVWIRRKVSPRQKQAVLDLGLEGLFFEREEQRIYPGGSLAGHLLGFANVDLKGAAGVELSEDARLAEGGEPLRLTIDTGVQFALEDELSDAAKAFEMKGAAGLVVEARTGAVRAMASWPPVDPNRPGDASDNDRLNRATGAVYELGSVFKPFTIAAALDAGVLRPSDTFDVSRPLELGGMVVHDDHILKGRVTAREIIAQSSNIGTVMIASLMGARQHEDFLRALGVLDKPDFDFPGLAHPLLPENWGETEAATIAYGHGVAISPLALAEAYTAFANGGERVKLRLIEPGPEDVPDMTRVMSAPSAAVVMQMMRAVVTEGTGGHADVAGYEIAGKTGTAEKPVAGGYDDKRNVASFAAVFPASRPEYVVLIVLDEPTARPGEGQTAGYNAAAVAGRLIARIAPLLHIEPVFDQPAGSGFDGVDRDITDKRAL